MISTYESLFALDKPVDMDEIGFTFAFNVNSGFKGKWANLNDSKFVEFVPAIKTKEMINKNKVYRIMPLGFHMCTEEDQKHFYNELGTNKKPDLSKLYCLDKQDKFGNPVNLTLYDKIDFYRKIVLMYRPRVPPKNETSNDSLKLSQKYVGFAQLKLVVN